MEAGTLKPNNGTFSIRLIVKGSAKKCADPMNLSLRTKDRAEAEVRASILVEGLALAELINAGAPRRRGRPPKKPHA